MMNVPCHKHVYKESARIPVLLNNVVSKHSAQSMCIELDVNVLQDIKAVLILNASPMSV